MTSSRARVGLRSETWLSYFLSYEHAVTVVYLGQKYLTVADPRD